MHSQFSLKQGLLIIFAITLLVAALHPSFGFLNFRSKATQVAFLPPIHLRIPTIEVNAAIDSVGLLPNGDMEAPSEPAHVGWYALGPYPGQKGSSVIDGHSGWKNNTPAVFDNLHNLRIGEKIYVEDENGSVVIYEVREVRIFDKDASALEVFSSTDGKAHLNLITCTGSWNEVTKNSSDRLVVFADMVSR